MGVGALLHDIGKIRVPDEVLNKPEALDDEERVEMKRHVEYGVDMLKESPDLSPESLEIVHCHHKRRYFTQRARDLNRLPKFSIVNLLTSGAYGIDVDDYAMTRRRITT